VSRRNEEHRIQSAFFKWAKYASVQYPGLKLMFAIPNGGARDAVTGAMLKREGVKPGVPDIFLACPVGEYHGLFIEMKTAKGRPSPEQREWLSRLRSRGYAAVICHGLDEAIDTATAYVTGRRACFQQGAAPLRRDAATPTTPEEPSI